MVEENIFHRCLFYSEKHKLFVSDKGRIYFLHGSEGNWLYFFHGANLRPTQLDDILNGKLNPRHHFLSENKIRVKTFHVLQEKIVEEITTRNNSGHSLPEGPLETWK